MTSDRWQRIEELYHAALARKADERAAFLAEACGADAELQREVESLLAQSVSGADALTTGGAEARAKSAAQAALIGRTIGLYHVQALLGVGGMGEVYRARDTKLGRDVAIKILPEILTINSQLVARFEREAKMLAAFNHPNIGALYGFEHLEGLHALVLELVDGEILADRIAKGPLPLKEALTSARQIADALDAAHDKGIVHRDLKPRNVGLTRDGIVKVLDFGLAKAVRGESVERHGSDSTEITEAGLVRALSSAPRLAGRNGLAAVQSTSAPTSGLGCVCEMLTGGRAFPARRLPTPSWP
jgi:serine/threonine protein kinase